ncbi:hypothetical protein FRC12_011607 [Ceratobasidium sp. 428]|nr:hypothetical protein FRC12_011607 [Ceratobasidium sp. 428]
MEPSKSSEGGRRLRYGFIWDIRFRHINSEAASAPISTLGAEKLQKHTPIKAHPPRNDLNFKESVSFWLLRPDRGLAAHQIAGLKGNKTHLSVGLGFDLGGLEKLPRSLFVTRDGPKHFKNGMGKSLNMTKSIYQGWLANLDAEMAHQEHPILCYVATFPSIFIARLNTQTFRLSVLLQI